MPSPLGSYASLSHFLLDLFYPSIYSCLDSHRSPSAHLCLTYWCSPDYNLGHLFSSPTLTLKDASQTPSLDYYYYPVHSLSYHTRFFAELYNHISKCSRTSSLGFPTGTSNSAYAKASLLIPTLKIMFPSLSLSTQVRNVVYIPAAFLCPNRSPGS